MKKTAIILGATGLTGNLLLKNLLSDNTYSHIKLFSRQKCGIENNKLTEYIGNIIDLEKFAKDFTAHEVFCCVGTTKAKSKDKEQYRAIDFGIPAKAAQLAKENNISFFAVISAIGANSQSRIFYNRTKGEMQDAVLQQNIPHTFILQPSLIEGKRNESRLVEDLGNQLFKFTNLFLVGYLKKYRSIKAQTIANALWKLPQIIAEQKIDVVINSEMIKQLAR